MIIIAFIIATIVILLMAYAARPNLNGFWEASEAYLKRSGTTAANVYIMDDQIYFYIKDDAGTILNRVVGWSHIYGYAWFEEDITPLPSTMHMRYDEKRGLLGFFEDDILMLELIKNNRITNDVACSVKN